MSIRWLRMTRVVLLAASVAPPATNLMSESRAQGVQYQVDVSVDDAVRTASVDSSNQPALILSAETPGVGKATGRAYAKVGVNQAASTLKGSDPASPIYSAYSLSTSNWGDIITISHPRLNGTRGTFTARVRVLASGSFAVADSWIPISTVDFLSQWRAGIQVIDSQGVVQDAVRTGLWRPNPERTALEYIGDPLGNAQADVSFSFVYGEPFSLTSSLQTNMRVTNLQRTPGTIDTTLEQFTHGLRTGRRAGTSRRYPAS